MILVIAKQNTKNLLSKYIDIKDCIYEYTNNINQYVNVNLMQKNVNLIEKIIIDINSLTNTNEEIIQALYKIKYLYNIQIIILALRYKVGNTLLASLFEIGIYDFVISEDSFYQDEEFRKALNGNNYIDAIKFKIKDNLISKNKIKKKFLKQANTKKLACFSIIQQITSKIFKYIGYSLFTILLSIGATVLINKNIRELLIEILRGGI